MSTMKCLLLALVAFTLALSAAPAAAERERGGGFRGGHREERHEGHEPWEHRSFGFFFPAPYPAPYCYTQQGYWAWDGWQYVWVPPQTVCP